MVSIPMRKIKYTTNLDQLILKLIPVVRYYLIDFALHLSVQKQVWSDR